MDLSKVELIIVETAVLHNIAILQKEKILLTTNDIQEQISLVNNVTNDNVRNNANDRTRMILINRHFGKM